MKKELLLGFILLLATLFACSDEVLFPDPGLDMSSSADVVVWRDTADSYTVAYDVFASGGIQYIEILDGRTYKQLEKFTEYEGKKEFVFSHTFDFSDIPNTKDSLCMYAVRILQKDGRGYNKAIKIQVNGLSAPKVQFANSSATFVSMSAVYGFSARITTGINVIKAIRVYFEGQMVDEILNPSKELHENKDDPKEVTGLAPLSSYILDFTGEHIYNEGHEYEGTVFVEDDKGQTRSTPFTIVDGKLKKPYCVTVVNGYHSISPQYGPFIFAYDDAGRCDMILVMYATNATQIPGFHDTFASTEFQYTSQDLYRLLKSSSGWEQMERWYYDEGGRLIRREYDSSSTGSLRYIDYSYDAQGRVLPYNVMKVNSSTGSVTIDKVFNNFKYDADGDVIEMDMAGTSVRFAYEKIYGEKQCVETWISGIYYASTSKRYRYDGFVPVINPTYIPDQPVALFQAPWDGSEMRDFVCNKYIFTQVRPNNDFPGNQATESFQLDYALDADGTLRRWQVFQYHYHEDPVPVTFEELKNKE